MTVRIFAIVLELLGVLLIIIGGQGDSPVGFVGPALMLLSGILLFTPSSLSDLASAGH